MKSFCTSALAVLASMGWAAGQAAAQQGASSLPPLLTRPSATTNYNLPPGGMSSPYGSIFATSRQDEVPEANRGQLIDGADGSSDFQQAVGSEWVDCQECSASRSSGWFGTVGALVMGRSRANPFWTTFDTGSGEQLLNTQDAGVDWNGGWQFTGGYMFGGGDDCQECTPCCGPYGGCGVAGPGIGFSYWGLGQMRGFSEINSPTNELSTPIELGAAAINGVPVSDYFDNSASHRVWRNDRVNNFEANLFFGVWNFNRWTLLPFAGFRYFRFDERLTFGGLTGGEDWSDPLASAYLANRSVNNLYGGQIGTYANYWITDRFGLYVGPKVGLYGNQINGRTLLYDGQGNGTYDIAAHKADFSILAEIDTGFTYFFNPGLFAYMGYRVVGVTNIALSDNQFLPNIEDVHGFGQVKQNGSLILHGVMMGGGFVF